jgi:hypothetical protein
MSCRFAAESGGLVTAGLAGLVACAGVTTPLARWCRLRSFLDSAAAHGITALDAIRDALAGKPWLPPLPAAADGT